MKVYIDLSNLMKVNFITGIQRVVREIVIRMIESKRFDMILMNYSAEKQGFICLDNEKFYNCFKLGTVEKTTVSTAKIIRPEDFESGAIFFDIDSVWNSRIRRTYLFPILKSRGVKIVTQLYDLIPIQHPQYCHENTVLNFMAYTGANINYADLIITSANATAKQLDLLCDRLQTEHKNCVTVPLGCDFIKKNSKNNCCSEVEKAIKSGDYILMVGTIEPRKNHTLVLDALDNGLKKNVIFAGRIGWNVSELEKRIRNHSLNGKRLFYFDNASDDDIAELYKNAFAVAFPTYNEGFGLPVIEAFSFGTPVFASDIEVLHEVAGDFADYFDNTSVEDFCRVVKEYSENQQKYDTLKEKISEFVPFTWDECAEKMMTAIESISTEKYKVPEKVKQMAVLTARNEDILQTLPYIDKFMQFIEEIVICCPPKNVEELKNSYNGRIKLKFLTDDELLNGNKLPDDHTTRNFYLRCLMMQNDIFDDVFIMTDDDYRPLCNIPQTVFLNNGKYNAYHCYDLRKWTGTYNNYTSFDTSMFRTLKFLEENNYPEFQYSSHQPQIIDRRIYKEMLNRHDGIQLDGLDEWSSYFNYGVYRYPEIFKPMTYVSMCWPGARSDWDIFEQPEKFLFENHYSVLYSENHIFNGFSETLDENTEAENLEKVVLYTKELQKQCEGHTAYEAYCKSYELIYHEKPSFTVYSLNDEIRIHVPIYIELKSQCWKRIPLVVTKEVYKKFGANCSFSCWFSDSNGNHVSEVNRTVIKKNDNEIPIPLRIGLPTGKYTLNFKFICESKNIQTSTAILAVII